MAARPVPPCGSHGAGGEDGRNEVWESLRDRLVVNHTVRLGNRVKRLDRPIFRRFSRLTIVERSKRCWWSSPMSKANLRHHRSKTRPVGVLHRKTEAA